MSTAVFGAFLTLLSARHFVPTPLCTGPVAPRLYLSVSISGDAPFGQYTTMTSPASVYYSDCWANAVPTDITGRHAIFTPTGYDNLKAFNNFSSSSGSWSGWLNANAIPAWCYFAEIEASQAEVYFQTAASPEICAPQLTCTLTLSIQGQGDVSGADPGLNESSCTPIHLVAVPAEGWDFARWSGAVTSNSRSVSVFLSGDMYVTAEFAAIPAGGSGGNSGGGNVGEGDGTYNEDLPCFPGIDGWCSPIVFNLGNGDYKLTGKNAPVLFDIRGDGHPLLMGWTERDADEAFLWLDRDHNGLVTSGAELFGNFTPLRNGAIAKNGFEALAEFDANHDGIVDDLDPIWSELRLWRDLNHNGVSEPNESTLLNASEIAAIDLNDHWTGKHDGWGNGFRYQSLISIRNGSAHSVRKRPVYDIFFVSVPR